MIYAISEALATCSPDNTLTFKGYLRQKNQANEIGNLIDGTVNMDFKLATTINDSDIIAGFSDSELVKCVKGLFTITLANKPTADMIRLGKLLLRVTVNNSNLQYFNLITNFNQTPSDGFFNGYNSQGQDVIMRCRTYPIIWNMVDTARFTLSLNIPIKRITQVSTFLFNDAKNVFHLDKMIIYTAENGTIVFNKPTEITNANLYINTTQLGEIGFIRGYINVWYNDLVDRSYIT